MDKIITTFHTIFTPVRIRELMSLHTGAHGYEHVGPDKIQAVSAKGTKENKMLL